MSNVMSVDERDALLLEWKSAHEALTEAKDAEMKLRKRIVDESGLFDPNKEEGTQTVELGAGWKIKAVKSLNYKTDNANGEAFSVLAQLDTMGEVVSHIAKDLFKFDANLRTGKYKELAKVSPEAYKLLQTIITTKPASPSIELVAPKSKD
jgi:hypothetical protein